MDKFSLMYPESSDRKCETLTDEAVNDLSVEFLLDALSEDNYEKNLMRKIMVQVTDDEETIRYRRDVFDDFLKHPKLRDEMSELVKKLADLREIERFQKDQEASSLWMLINRLREIDEYVACITQLKELLEGLDIRSAGMLRLKEIVTEIYHASGFPELKKDIDETFEKAQKLRSITIGAFAQRHRVQGLGPDEALPQLCRRRRRPPPRHGCFRHKEVPPDEQPDLGHCDRLDPACGES